MPRKQLLPALARSIKDETRQQIRKDREGLPDDVGEILDTIVEKLFDPGFTVGDLHHLCSPTPATLFRFRDSVGHNLKPYVDLTRGQIARRLVCESDALLGDIAECLGFANAELFGKWFKRRHGVSPTWLRRLLPAMLPLTKVPPAEESEPPSLHSWRKAVVGAVPRDEAFSQYRRFRTQLDASEPSKADLDNPFAVFPGGGHGSGS